MTLWQVPSLLSSVDFAKGAFNDNIVFGIAVSVFAVMSISPRRTMRSGYRRLRRGARLRHSEAAKRASIKLLEALVGAWDLKLECFKPGG